MSALGPFSEVGARNREICFAPRIEHRRPDQPRPKGANSPDIDPLLDHLVGTGEQRRRHIQSERLGGFQIYDEFELGRLNDWQVRRSLALQDSAAIDTADCCAGPGAVRSTAATPRREMKSRRIIRLLRRRE